MADSDNKATGLWARSKAKAKRISVLVLVFALGFFLKWVITGPTQPPKESGHAHTEQAPEKQQVWTCSMHPQIKLPKKGLCPICNMDLIPLAMDETEMATSMRQLTVSENAKKLMDIEVAWVERKFVSAVVRMVGKVDYDETKLAYITAWIPGRLDRLYVDYTGVPVNKGDHMAYLYSPELISAQEELLQAIEAVKNIRDTELNVMREMTESTLSASREKLRLWGLTAEQIAEIERTGKVQDHMTIYAPTSGIVIHKNALEGMYVQTGTKIYTIADLTKVWIKLDAYESDLEWLRYGQVVEFTTVSYPGRVFKGMISFIDPILDEKT
ncbi:MAG: efflux RND transporter periplasmic adaptor subunit, partial [Planctomycetota bacterium]